MNVIRRSSLFACFTLLAPGVQSQECPRSIDVDQSQHGHLDNWNASTVTSSHALAGLQLVHGELHPDVSETPF